MFLQKIGLIAGEGKFPIIFAKNAKEKGIEIVAVGIEGKTKEELNKYVDELLLVKLGELSKLIAFLKQNSINQLVMAGKIPKIHLFDKNIALDRELKSLLDSVEDRKDDSLLKGVAKYLEKMGMTLLDSTIFLKDNLPEKGILTKRHPTDKEYENIEFGRSIAKRIAELDIGQTVVVKDKAVLAVEAIEHTDETIRRGGRLGNGDVIVVKVSRPKQDMRFDVPVVGLDTIKSLKQAKAKVLAVESKKTLFIDKSEIIEEADKSGISIIAF